MHEHTQQKCLHGRGTRQVGITFSLLSALVIGPLLIGCGSKAAKPALKATLVGEGTISGRVTLEGTPPKEQKLPIDGDAACSASCKKHKLEMPRYTRTYVTKDGGLGDVLVTLIDIPPQPIPSGTEALTIEQRGCEYHPYVAACQVDQPIHVTNQDALTHNIHTMPKVSGNKEVNKSQAEGSKMLEFVYDKPEEFLQFKCDVHPWMFSYVSVVNHPFYAVTSEDGHFSIKGLPDGKYKVKFKHRKAGELTKEVEIKDGKATVEVVLTAPKA